jgi:hypothetical protein
VCCDRSLTPDLFNGITEPLVERYQNEKQVLTLVTQFGRQPADCEDSHLFVYGNCAFSVSDGYMSLTKLEDAGYTCNPSIRNIVTASRFSNAGDPKCHIINRWVERLSVCNDYLQLTMEFHGSNAAAVLFAQAGVWAGTNFVDWIKLDSSFPILYLLASHSGVGKTTAQEALAMSIGFAKSAVAGNKSSEAGFLDWVSKNGGLSLMLDDFNPNKSSAKGSNDAWLDLFKQLYDAKTQIQHEKSRQLQSSVVISSNFPVPQDIPTQMRMLTLQFFNPGVMASTDVVRQYKNIMSVTSCLIPDIVSMRHEGELDKKYIGELESYIQKCLPTGLNARVSQNIKKPMYYLLLTFAWCDFDQSTFDKYIFDYMETLIAGYAENCMQTDLWTRFFKYLRLTLERQDRKSGTSLHWYVY